MPAKRKRKSAPTAAAAAKTAAAAAAASARKADAEVVDDDDADDAATTKSPGKSPARAPAASPPIKSPLAAAALAPLPAAAAATATAMADADASAAGGDEKKSRAAAMAVLNGVSAAGRAASAGAATAAAVVAAAAPVSAIRNKTTALLKASSQALTSTAAVVGRSLQITGLNGCYHYYAQPSTLPELKPEQFKYPLKPAREWKFALDDFQRVAITCIDQQHNVLVAAHTSAGKTVLAEYAIAVALRDKQRVIYTAPIKVLSNQKYRELKEIFDDVGLMTGDVNLNPSASCLVMTTEILRNMMLRGSEVMREVSWVIFDEVHYMRDRERGVVWEESIILLPATINQVFLSATLTTEDSQQFCDWVCRLKSRPCHVVSTNHRPTPLCHYLFPTGGEGLYLAVDEKGVFKRENVAQARTAMTVGPERKGGNDRRGGGGGGAGNDLVRLVQLMIAKDWLPIIVFSFSRRECEGRALQISKLDLTTPDEKELINTVFTQAMASLSEEDRVLNQIETVLPLLRRGIGVHHSGLLPIVKETVEILFGESLIKILFATETFAMGVNMPARSCIFTSLQKFDGRQFRNVTSGEYIQMSGRAGRRNRDDRGICVTMIDDSHDSETLEKIFCGSADRLVSTFRLSYNMILNLMRAESAAEPEAIIKASLHQYQHDSAQPRHEEKMAALERELASLTIPAHNDLLASYEQLTDLAATLNSQLRKYLNAPPVLLPFLQSGRVVYIRGGASEGADKSDDWGWAIVVNYRRRFQPSTYVVDVLLPIRALKQFGKLIIPRPYPVGTIVPQFTFGAAPQPPVILPLVPGGIASTAAATATAAAADAKSDPSASSSSEPVMEIVSFGLNMIERVSSVRLYMPVDIRPVYVRQQLHNVLFDITTNNYPDGNLPVISAREMLNGAESLPATAAPASSAIATTSAAGASSASTPTATAASTNDKLALLLRRLDNVSSRMASSPLHAAIAAAASSSTATASSNATASSSTASAGTALTPAAAPSSAFVPRTVRDHLTLYRHKQAVAGELHALKRESSRSQLLMFRGELKNRLRVLRRLGHIDDDGVMLKKGRVACEIESVDELLVTELIFDGVFNTLNPASCVALLTACFDMPKSSQVSALTPDLTTAFARLQTAARTVAKVAVECNMGIKEDDYVNWFQSSIMGVTLAWCEGKSFTTICGMTDMFEGQIIRTMRRLDELLNQMKLAAQSISNPELEEKFTAGQKLMKRGIIFAGSLYL